MQIEEAIDPTVAIPLYAFAPIVFESSHISKPIADFGHPTPDLTSKL
jgi:hypothetical protein